MKTLIKEKYWHELFEIGIVLKGINGIWETLSGILILFLNKATLSNWFSYISYHELLEDPGDKFINFFAGLLQNLSSSTQTFVAIYILFHGCLNIFLSIQLYRKKHWAYLVTIVSIILFLFYQVYRVYLYHSVFL